MPLLIPAASVYVPPSPPGAIPRKGVPLLPSPLHDPPGINSVPPTSFLPISRTAVPDIQAVLDVEEAKRFVHDG